MTCCQDLLMLPIRNGALGFLALYTLACLGCSQTVAEPVADAVADPVAEAVTTPVSAPAVISAADAVATVKHEPIPDAFPRIEVQRLQLRRLQAERLPVLLMGALTFASTE